MEVRKNEKVIFFNTDEQSNPKSRFREYLKISDSLCDCIIFYSRTQTAKEEGKVVVCFVELKGRDIKKAVEQVTNTSNHFRKRIGSCSDTASLNNEIEWKAYICRHGSAPGDKEEERKLKLRLEQNFDKADIARNPDIGAFLRQ